MNAKFDDHFSRTAVILQGTLHGILSSPKSLFGREAISIVSITTAVLVSAQTSCSSNTLLGFICHLKLTSLKECTHKPPSKLAFFFVFCVFQLDWYLRVNWELWVWHHRIPGLIMLLGRELLCDIYCNAVSYSNCYVFSEASVYIFKYYSSPLLLYQTKCLSNHACFYCTRLMIFIPWFQIFPHWFSNPFCKYFPGYFPLHSLCCSIVQIVHHCSFYTGIFLILFLLFFTSLLLSFLQASWSCCAVYFVMPIPSIWNAFIILIFKTDQIFTNSNLLW